jgi:hypothetical protein
MVLVAIAALFVVRGVERAYLVYIPSRFLIESDVAAEKGDWQVECSARDVGLLDIPHPELPLEWSEVPVQASDGSYKVMRLPGCELVPLALPQAKVQPGGRVDFMTGVSYFVPGRGLIFSRQETATGLFTWNQLSGDRITAIPGVNAVSPPVLSIDGKWAAWLEREALAIERIDGSEAPLQVILKNVDLSSFVLRTVDTQREEVELLSDDRRLVIGFDGRIKTSERRSLRWDAYLDNGPYRVSWNLNGHSGMHDVLKGRSINAVASTPSGDLIAVSVATALNIGHVRDSVYVLRSDDGTEVFRRYLPAYTRTPVLFPANDRFVYSADRQVVVLRVSR